MATIDLVFEGGGAKGMAFVGALEELLDMRQHRPGRLIGTSAGAITAALLAAGYTVPEMMASLNEKENGRSVFEAFLGMPEPFDKQAVRDSAIRDFLKDVNLTLVPDFIEDVMDDKIAQGLADHPRYRHLFSFVERGGWYSADAFVKWMARKLDEGTINGKPRQFSQMTLAQLYAATQTELTLVVSDTTAQRMLILNHNTAPDCPVVWAVRMSMSIPLLWEEVVWQKEWGTYRGKDITGHIFVDGGMLSNFPIALFLAPDPHVVDVMGKPNDYVLGLLIDEATPVPLPAERALVDIDVDPSQLETVKRLMRLANTAITAHDNAAIEVFHEQIVRLPAGGYGTTEFNMSDAKRKALVDAGRKAMQDYLNARPNLFVPTRAAGPRTINTADVASRMADNILSQ